MIHIRDSFSARLNPNGQVRVVARKGTRLGLGRSVQARAGRSTNIRVPVSCCTNPANFHTRQRFPNGPGSAPHTGYAKPDSALELFTGSGAASAFVAAGPTAESPRFLASFAFLELPVARSGHGCLQVHIDLLTGRVWLVPTFKTATADGSLTASVLRDAGPPGLSTTLPARTRRRRRRRRAASLRRRAGRRPAGPRAAGRVRGQRLGVAPRHRLHPLVRRPRQAPPPPAGPSAAPDPAGPGEDAATISDIKVGRCQ